MEQVSEVNDSIFGCITADIEAVPADDEMPVVSLASEIGRRSKIVSDDEMHDSLSPIGPHALRAAGL